MALERKSDGKMVEFEVFKNLLMSKFSYNLSEDEFTTL
jgi:hypothetical protein